MSSPKIAFLSPVAESVPPQAFQHAMAAALKAMDNGIRVEQIGVTEKTLVQSARNILAKGFLETGCEWAFWWDCDVIVPANVIVQLYKTAIECQTKFVTGIYYQRIGDHFPVLWKKNPVLSDGTMPKLGPAPPTNETNNEAYRHFYLLPGPNNVRPFAADVCGFGCVLTHREMFEKITYPWFKMISGECSEDFYFCVEAKKAGYNLMADPSLRLGHIGPARVVFREDMRPDIKTVLPLKESVK